MSIKEVKEITCLPYQEITTTTKSSILDYLDTPTVFEIDKEGIDLEYEKLSEEILAYKKENKIAFEDLKDKECFFSNGVLYMKIFSQDLKEYDISCVNAISIVNAGLTKFDNNELVIKVKRIINK